MKTPCQDCTNRCLGCHGTCERYKEFRSALDNKNAKIRAEKQQVSAVYESRRLLSTHN